VPVDAKVAAILFPICALLPTPVTIILPFELNIVFTA